MGLECDTNSRAWHDPHGRVVTRTPRCEAGRHDGDDWHISPGGKRWKWHLEGDEYVIILDSGGLVHPPQPPERCDPREL